MRGKIKTFKDVDQEITNKIIDNAKKFVKKKKKSREWLK